MKQLSIGILAHVDAGKTTLSEAMLYLTGAIRSPGRVDHGNTHFDTDSAEKKRGITVFSKQACFTFEQTRFYLLDTPGHVDFSTEAERVIPVLDYAILLISAPDGVQAHTETLWNLLKHYCIPTVIFVNKVDLPNSGKAELIRLLSEKLSADCIDFSGQNFQEDAAVRDESLLEQYLDIGSISDSQLGTLICERTIFPVLFGSALRHEGVKELLSLLARYGKMRPYSELSGARIYKIMHDAQGNRLTFVKVTGGRYSVRDSVAYCSRDGSVKEEKITGIRLYTGDKYQTASEITPGAVCALTGLSATYVGLGLGSCPDSPMPLLEPYMVYSLLLPADCSIPEALMKMRQLEEEDPALHIEWDERNKEIKIHLMGNVQIEILEDLIRRRFGMNIKIGKGSILYRETITGEAVGIGHYEPLRHYAEVHLLLRPLSPGEGLKFTTHCSTDELDLNWQRLILTHLEEKMHLGILTGSPITDMEICLTAGKAHLKHTEGGDFRQATYRAVRQGLMQANCVLLEPYVTFTLEIPSEHLGRAMQDVRKLHAAAGDPVQSIGGISILTGNGPASTLNGYEQEVASYTRGRGRFSYYVSHYGPCHNAAEVITAAAYDPEADTDNSPDSIFCSHGAGINVKWSEVAAHCHIPPDKRHKTDFINVPVFTPTQRAASEKELEAILEREFGPIRRKQYRPSESVFSDKRQNSPSADPQRQILIIDGYNLIFAWPGLQDLAETDLESARECLMDIISNYSAFTGSESILVFDAYKVKGGRGERFEYKNISIVFTKENETGDMYIERLCASIGKHESVRVITSDGLIQISALRTGVRRESAREFMQEIAEVKKQMSLKAEANGHG